MRFSKLLAAGFASAIGFASGPVLGQSPTGSAGSDTGVSGSATGTESGVSTPSGSETQTQPGEVGTGESQGEMGSGSTTATPESPTEPGTTGGMGTESGQTGTPTGEDTGGFGTQQGGATGTGESGGVTTTPGETTTPETTPGETTTPGTTPESGVTTPGTTPESGESTPGTSESTTPGNVPQGGETGGYGQGGTGGTSGSMAGMGAGRLDFGRLENATSPRQYIGDASIFLNTAIRAATVMQQEQKTGGQSGQASEYGRVVSAALNRALADVQQLQTSQGEGGKMKASSQVRDLMGQLTAAYTQAQQLPGLQGATAGMGERTGGAKTTQPDVQSVLSKLRQAEQSLASVAKAFGASSLVQTSGSGQ